MISGILLLIGKLTFLLALYGFLFAVYRGLVAETRRGVKALDVSPVPVPAAAERTVLRPSTPAPAIAPVAPVVVPPVASTVESATATTIPALLTNPSPPLVISDDDDMSVTPTMPLAEQTVLPRPTRLTAATLSVLSSPGTGLTNGQQFTLGEVTRIGRSDDNDIKIEDRFVSTHHIELARKNDRIVIRDLGSTNGTFRNGARVQRETPLEDGDRIGVGTTMFIFHDSHQRD